MRAKPVYKVTTYLPVRSISRVMKTIRRVVQLKYGNYDCVAWWCANWVEEFRPLKGSNPTSGKRGKLERVPSVKLQITIPRKRKLLKKIIERGIVPNHPWEVPVILVDETEAIRVRRKG